MWCWELMSLSPSKLIGSFHWLMWDVPGPCTLVSPSEAGQGTGAARGPGPLCHVFRERRTYVTTA